LAFVVLAAIVAAQDPRELGYIIGMKGEWRDDSSRVLRPLSLLNPGSHVRLASRAGEAAPMIRIRFFQGLCEQPVNCSDAVRCDQPISVDQLFSRLADTCRVKPGSWANAIVAAWTGFFHPTSSGEPGLAITMSRAAESNDDDGDGPSLRESVLLVDSGRIDLAPLFKTAANGSFSLQFCDPGPELTENCGESTERERLPVKIANGLPAPAEFSKPAGLYRVRLWRMTPKGPQPTEKTAIALIGPKSNLAGKQQAFQEISASASDMARTDPMIRMMLIAWLAESARRTAP
jgi:hypothetical protein